MKLFAEQRTRFPDPRHTIEGGIIAVDNDLSVNALLEAYSFGIFPWPYEDLPVLWFSPPERGVLDFVELKVPTSLKKFYKNHPFEIRFNTHFSEVLKRCATQVRPDQTGTWITAGMQKAYEEFHKAGYAHSVEAWQDDKLVGGMYGVYVAGSFSAESMFYLQPNASKVCMLRMIEVLKDNGLQWVDIQMVTPHTKRFGGKFISRDNFLRRLEKVKQHVHAPLIFPN